MLRYIAATTAVVFANLLPDQVTLAQEAPIESASSAISVEAQPLASALREFSDQSGLQVAYLATLADNKVSQGTHGADTVENALSDLLDSTGLEYQFVNDVTVAIGPSTIAAVAGDRDPGNGKTTGASPRAVIMAQAVTERNQASRRTTEVEEGRTEETDKKPLEEIVVTGTLIRGIAPESSPLQIYTREDILGSGVTTTEQFIRTLPQNFKGGSSELVPVGLPSDASAALNFTYGTGANLRGLGAGGTLILLNGNRLAPTSSIGDFVDLSLIPVSALERVDVLTDGASSIYGGDAIAGVINFVLRNDFDGAETAVRYGNVTEGDMEEYRVSQTLGTAWNSGSILGVYEYFDRENLTLADRQNIQPPSLNNGDPIVDLDLFDLLPQQNRHSAMLAFNQELSPALKMSGSGLYSKRTVDGSSINSSGAGVLVDTHSESEAATFSGGAQYEITGDWSIELNSTYSKLTSNQVRMTSINTTPSSFDSDSDVWAVDFGLNGVLFSLPGGVAKVAAGGQFRDETFSFVNTRTGELIREADRDVSAVYGELFLPLIGENNSIPGIERFEINLSGRIDDYSDFGSAANPKIGVLWAPNTNLKIRTSYGESFSPPPLGRVGDRQSTANVLPTSLITGALGIAGQYPSLEPTDYMIVVGVASDLKPETSKTFTAGADYTADFGPHSWSASANYYDISFENRLGRTPIPGNLDPAIAPFLVFDDPASFPPGTAILFPSTDEVNAVVSQFDLPPNLLAGATMGNIGVVNNANIIRNLARTKTNGVDLSVDYQLRTDFGQVSAGFNANYIIEFTQQASVATPEVDILNTLYNPVDLQLRGKLGLTYDQFSANLFVNFTDSYKTDSTAAGKEIDSWLTADLVLKFEFETQSGALLNGVDLNLSVTNVFNEMPPTTSSIGRFQIAGFDPANASPLGRFVAFEIRKAF